MDVLVNCNMATRIVSSHLEIKRTLRLVYQHVVNAVNPNTLIRNAIKCTDSTLHVDNKTYSLNNNLYLVGFGKAVFGMAHQVELKLRQHLQGGIISIPIGQKEMFKNIKLMDGSMVKIFEGAKNNRPDEDSENAAKHIVELAKSLGETDLLIVLISGGGSALLPYPAPPVTLKDKATVTELLAKSGADIVELNSVRKRLSVVKGGGLLNFAYPAKVITFILSDIVGDPLDLIASGPTVINQDDKNRPNMIFEKYSLLDKIPSSVKKVLERPVVKDSKRVDVQNVLIGSNRIALEAALAEVKKLNYKAVVLTDILEGFVREICLAYIELVINVCKALSNEPKSDFVTKTRNIINKLHITDDKLFELADIIYNSKTEKLCLLIGGEPTVKVTGKGLGGRSQQLVLEFSNDLNTAYSDNSFLNNFNVGLLCGGTDGIDGPTDAAGAVGYNGQMKSAKEQKLDPNTFIQDCDSYSFFSKFNNGEDLLKVGHTGTNVMDVHILLIELIK